MIDNRPTKIVRKLLLNIIYPKINMQTFSEGIAFGLLNNLMPIIIAYLQIDNHLNNKETKGGYFLEEFSLIVTHEGIEGKCFFVSVLRYSDSPESIKIARVFEVPRSNANVTGWLKTLNYL
jgi:hypothetical protein